MDFLANRKIGFRISLGFSVVIAIFLVAVLVVAQSASQRKEMDAWNVHTYKVLGTGESMLTGMINMETGARGFLVAGNEAFLEPYALGRKQFEAAMKEAKSLTSDNAVQQKRLDEMARLHVAFVDVADSLIAQRRAVSGGRSRIEDVVVEFGKARDKAAMDGFRGLQAEFMDMERVLLEQRRASAESLASREQAALFGGATVAIILAIAVGMLLKRSVVVPVRQAVEAAENLASGRFGMDASVAKADEIGDLLRSIAKAEEVVRSFTLAQQDMARRHEEGAISERVDARRFPGEYGALAEKVNALVESHIGVTFQLVDVVDRFSQGDFSKSIPKLPGEKARISEVCEQARANLLTVSGEIKRLSAAAAQGDFSPRGDVSRLSFEYKDMVANLNRLMDEASRGIDEVGRNLKHLADGDLTRRVEGSFAGRFADLQADYNTTAERLHGLMTRIRGGSGTIHLAATEIASGNQDLSSRTEEQASSLEETASSMEELTSTVKQNAENARQANQLVVGASDVATKGGTVVREVVRTMGEISESSKKIADIIAVIDGIAFQTNILALNAAVEAARAGEQGRGFAVVATEVRNLAQRSAAAAKEIKDLISDSVSRVDAGSRLVDEAGRTMEEIVMSVKRVTDIMAEITAASAEQSSGIEQVNQAITQMDEVTQQNAALVEEAAAAAESLKEEARVLSDAVAVFKLEGSTSSDSWDGHSERRGPDRAKNVARLPAPGKAKPAAEAARGGGRKAAVASAALAEEWERF